MQPAQARTTRLTWLVTSGTGSSLANADSLLVAAVRTSGSLSLQTWQQQCWNGAGYLMQSGMAKTEIMQSHLSSCRYRGSICELAVSAPRASASAGSCTQFKCAKQVGNNLHICTIDLVGQCATAAPVAGSTEALSLPIAPAAPRCTARAKTCPVSTAPPQA